MCGIVGIFNIKQQSKEIRTKALKMSQRLRHRGPDWSGIYVGGSAILAHERLSIVDPRSGGQPLYSPDRKLILSVNGEIYNHRQIRERYANK
ncbi:Asparagine synthetase B (glutamine-hydrolyzing), partial [termite gut metagenome]